MKTIIAALDFSDTTEAVVETAQKLAQAFQAKLELVHVVEPEPAYAAYGFTPEEFPAIHTFQREARSRAEEALEHHREKINGVSEVEARLLEGVPMHSLLKHAEATEADLVILGSHGHGAIASVLLGSVADGMVRKAKVPVLVVPAPGRE